MKRRPHSFKKERPIYLKKSFWFGVLIVLFLAGAIYLIFFTPYFKLKKIEIGGNQKILTKDIAAKVDGLFHIEDYIFSVRPEKVRQEILRSFPQAANVKTEFKALDSVFIFVEERKPAAVFCQNEECFLVDEEGIIFEKILQEDSGILSVINNYFIKKEAILGEEMLSGEDISKILKFNESLVKIEISVSEFRIISKEKIEIATKEGWDIFVNFQNDIDWQMVKLEAVLAEKIPSEKRSGLEYIELRFGNLAPFKYR
ncbi:MAG: FtsQ-type POTRA domain-containing protein [Candidatus Pacebacteria bacterium]|nr:FtsQ-type POTRA domain-containing protein [Candidatus Paceibacterota bacterium]